MAPTPTLAERAQHNVLADQMRREVNVARAILHAEAAALEEGEPTEGEPSPDREVDDDWLYRWRDSASTVSNEKLQDLWGRALAGEVKSPGTFSLRTLEFLKNLSPEEAQRVAKLAPFVIDGDFVYGAASESFLRPYGITVGELMVLDDLGVISYRYPGLKKTIQITSNGVVFCAHNLLLAVRPGAEGADTSLWLPIHLLTPVGRQVLRLGSFTADAGYLRRVGETIKEKGFKVELARVRSAEQNGVRYADAEEL